MTRLDEIEKDLCDRGEQVLKSTVPIYRIDERRRLELFGTGILVRQESRHFVISAAHVLAELRQRQLAIGGENRTVPIAGPFFHTGAVGEVEFDNDAFDVAFVALSDEAVQQLDGSVFLSVNEIERTESPLSGGTYRAVGFIASDYRTALPGKPAVAKGTTLATTPAEPASYKKRGVDETSHLLLSLDRVKTYSAGRLTATPKLHGMSGSGVWRTRADGTDELVAVMTEHHQKDGKFIVSTRLAAVLAGISRHLGGELQDRTPAKCEPEP